MQPLITGSGIKSLCPNLDWARANKISDDLISILPHYGMYTKEILPDFLAQVIVESGRFRLKVESLNYITAARIVQVWPSRFTLETAAEYVKQPVKLANKVYNGRNGNINPNDGWDFRGSGYIQCTGRAMAEMLCEYYMIKDPVQMFELLRTDDYWAMASATWVFAVNKKLIPLALADDVKTIRRRINGGLTGLAEAEAIFKKAKTIIMAA
jgi:putative chitinase